MNLEVGVIAFSHSALFIYSHVSAHYLVLWQDLLFEDILLAVLHSLAGCSFSLTIPGSGTSGTSAEFG